MTQTGKATAGAIGDFSNGLSNQLTSDLTASLNETVANTLTQLNDGLNLGQTNVSSLITETQSYVEQNIQSLVEQSISNTVSTTGATDQHATLNMRGTYCEDSPVTLDQDTVIEQCRGQCHHQLGLGRHRQGRRERRQPDQQGDSTSASSLSSSC